MKKLLIFFLVFMPFSGIVTACTDSLAEEKPTGEKKDEIFHIPSNILITPEIETDSLIRNPCMGWGLYDDASDLVTPGTYYWALMDQYVPYCTHLYIRWRWSDMEPEEGKYAWIYNEEYKKLVQGALDRGLKLSFRIYYDSNGNSRQSTPEYVFQAGAEGTEERNQNHYLTPYADDPVFQAKLSRFIQAFAAEYDDPEKVDYIDGFNLGYWGEGHTITYKNPQNKNQVIDWITNLYGNNFKKVIVVINYHQDIGGSNLQRVIGHQDYGLRHDAFGSKYYGTWERNFVQNYLLKTPVLAESCYWFVNTDKGKYIEDGIDYTEQWRRDYSYTDPMPAQSWHQVHERTCNEALEARANTLDMREKREAQSWTTESIDIVRKFIRLGGYRFTPLNVSLPKTISAGESYTLGHEWHNSGYGYCPNNNKRWNYKYKPAFALIEKNTGTVKQIFIDSQAEPSEWVRETTNTYKLSVKIGDLPAGKYYWGIAIIDRTRDNTPGLQLAIRNSRQIKNWDILHEVTLH